MKFCAEQLLLYAITDRAWTGRQTLYEQIEEVLKNGVTILQLREKNLSEEEFVEEAVRVKALCRKYGVPLIINDHVEVALKSGADGVHVGVEDQPVAQIRRRVGKDFIIGATAKTVEQAKQAEAAGADYLGVGAVFPSPTKKNAIRITKAQLNEICSSVSLPAVAIGGISEENLGQLAGSRVRGFAVVSAVFGAKDPGAAAARLLKQAQALVGQAEMKTMGMRTALSVAGSDSSGGAGIQADLKTMTMNGVFGMTAVTALTAQNTLGVTGIQEVSPEFLERQLDAVFEDIYPDAVKIGMVPSPELAEVIIRKLKEYQAKNLVVDPVMVATSGSVLSGDSAMALMKERLFPMARVITPNIPEIEALAGRKVNGPEEMVKAAEAVSRACGCAVLCKGGHQIEDANDLLFDHGEITWFRGNRIDNPNTHGTGCTLSSAIAANLAKGYDLRHSIERAKAFISGALAAMLDLGHGSGPLNHMFDTEGRFIGNREEEKTEIKIESE